MKINAIFWLLGRVARIQLLLELDLRKLSIALKLLGVQIDDKLSFDNHVSKLCEQASNKLYALARISPYSDQSKPRTLMRAFITSHAF